MINITLPDGSVRQFDAPVTVGEVAASIGAGLAKATLAGKVDDKLVDAGFRIDHDAALSIVTDKSPEALDILRHSTAHLLAQAVQRLFPGAQVTIGPVIDNGFYYDFAYERPFTPEDLPAIEAEMQKIVKEAHPVSRSVKSRDDAVAFFQQTQCHGQQVDDFVFHARPLPAILGVVDDLFHHFAGLFGKLVQHVVGLWEFYGGLYCPLFRLRQETGEKCHAGVGVNWRWQVGQDNQDFLSRHAHP